VVVIGERDAAQAVVLIRALSDVRHKMISQMTWLERHGAQLEAAALRRDINEAEAHIAGLQRRYVGGEIAASQHGSRDDGRWARGAWNAPPGTGSP
jgi:hypothetical protein